MRKSLGRLIIGIMILFLSASLVTACKPKNLRTAADKKNLNFGMAVQAGDVFGGPTTEFLAQNFNVIVAENSQKWANLRPTKNFWNWPDIDSMIAFAEKNNAKVKFHTFVWHQQNPPYVSSLKTADEARALLVEQIQTVMTRYKGKIFEYDVCNEIFNEDGTFRDTVWYRTLGPEYVDIAFKTAREADPDARLILNDYNNEYMGNPKADACYELVKSMKARGVPIDGVGFQLHMMAEFPIDEAALRGNMRRYAELGVSVSFTEVDVRIKMPVDEAKEAAQTAAFLKLLEVALTEPNAKSFILWGYTDKKSWVPGTFPGYGSAHPFDREEKPKKVWQAMKDMIEAPVK